MDMGLSSVCGPQGKKGCPPTNEYGLVDPMSGGGVRPLKAALRVASHPLHASEESYRTRLQTMNMRVLRDVQGLAAPLRLAAELRAASKVGRLPFIQSSQLSTATLTGADLSDIGFEDVLNPVELHERAVLPHVVMENLQRI